ncbi:hypothetical protein [Bacillus sp. B-jedd]|uniref:hypothetical protein n=1 Tax=Bacillus sp. B-jedd TaxID=1476857 RepID=UPI0005156CE2|nr:hypothetical protein [Bacillus sp. B-jedd]CEG27395.1 Iron-sulphur cluster biosynthesis [Bacillus sp. B-jedd]
MNLSLEEQKLPKDKEYDFEDLKILIHENDMVYFNDTKLDYVKDVFGSGRFQLLKI